MKKVIIMMIMMVMVVMMVMMMIIEKECSVFEGEVSPISVKFSIET